jgi:hypothetical protein
MIEVRFLRADSYLVKVKEKTETAHNVTLRESDRLRFAGEKIPAEKLIEESVRFLLEREPNTSILASFDLPVIGHYFPEYEQVIQERLQRQ